MDLYPGAIWRPSVISHPTRTQTRGIVIHNTYGHLDGDLSVLDGPAVDVHFYVPKDGRVFQFLDPDSMSWTAMRTANHTCLHIETEGTREQAWTEPQAQAVVRLVAYLCRRYGIPAVKVDPRGPDDGPDWRGLFDHRDLAGIDGNDHGDGLPPDYPGWPRFLALVKQELGKPGSAKPMTLLERLDAAGMGPNSAKAVAKVLGHLPPGYQGKPTPADSELFRKLVAAGFGPNSARQIIYARRFLMTDVA